MENVESMVEHSEQPETPKAPKARKLQAQKALTGAVLVSWFTGKDAERVSAKVEQAEMPRMKYLYSFFPASTDAEVRDAVKYLRTAAKETSGEKSPEYKTAKVRASEVTTLYGAFRFADVVQPTGGYHKAVADARLALKTKGIRPSGARIPEKWERVIDTEAGIKAAEFKAVEIARHKAEQKGEELTEEQAQEQAARTRDAIRKAGAVKLAKSLFEKQKAEFCGWLIEALEALIATSDEQVTEGEQTPEKEQKAA